MKVVDRFSCGCHSSAGPAVGGWPTAEHCSLSSPEADVHVEIKKPTSLETEVLTKMTEFDYSVVQPSILAPSPHHTVRWFCLFLRSLLFDVQLTDSKLCMLKVCA